MIKTLLNKKKRENLKETVEVIFAALTIISFATSRIKKHRSGETEEETECICQAS